jgi:hypothetical protein
MQLDRPLETRHGFLHKFSATGVGPGIFKALLAALYLFIKAPLFSLLSWLLIAGLGRYDI